MRRLIIVALLLVAAASSSNCSDESGANAVAPSPSVATSGGTAAFVNAGSVQGDDKASGGGSSISAIAVAMVSDSNADGRPNRGDSITFTISTTETWDQVGIVCSQNGTVVLRAVRTATEWSPITLTSSTWPAGDADCVATLDQFNGTRVMTLAVARFAAAA